MIYSKEYFLFLHYNLKDIINMKTKIKELCRERGLTISAIAEQIGMTQTSLSRALGDNGNPTLETLSKIADALSVDISELFTPFSGSIIGVIRIKDTNYNINSVSDLSRLLDRIESGEIVL